jgi:transposase
MKKGILFVGLEVDDKAFHVHLQSSQGEEFNFCCKPLISQLLGKLKPFKEQGYELRVCYEATYVGFSIQRKLRGADYFCEVIAPSLVPREAGHKVKTDRIDAQKLARYYSQGMLTVVNVPTEEEESVRDLLRSRNFLSKKVGNVKSHILSICRRYSMHFREAVDKKGANYWTQPHYNWLESTISKQSLGALRTNLSTLLMVVRQVEDQISSYDNEILKFAAMPPYEKAVKALTCFRGISTHTAMVLTTEIGDASRFDHPKRLTSFSGMDIVEKSSGASINRYSITRMGNRQIRTAVVEASQSATKPVRISSDLKRRRQGADPRSVEIADRCMLRLNRKGTRLLFAGKQKNKVTVACAREMLGFIWETLRVA